ncbi:hypothetical protein ACH4PU_20670 [Streptomyces sp. NPDC021100]|uniref:hypothetical protein n=1 Tax=Streptomyces sp. NPDC021100 TaxID=3365114 RepID=UPI003797296A
MPETVPEDVPESAPENVSAPSITTQSPPATAPFTLAPGGPPDVVTTTAGETGYPGIRITATGDEPVPPLGAYVALPRGKGLEFHAEGGANCLLTVRDAHGKTTAYPGNPSPDGRSLTFQGVGPALSGKGSVSTAWVAVRAGGGARPGNTALVFCLGDATSPSTPVRIADDIPFSVFPGGPPDITLDHDHPVGYPGVRVRADDDGTVSPQDVYVALPRERRLRFHAESGPNHGLTVQDRHGTQHLFPGHAASDGRAVLFPGVDLFLSEKGAESTLWVAVTAEPATAPADSARPDAPAAPKEPTALAFCVGVRTARSTPVVVDVRAW